MRKQNNEDKRIDYLAEIIWDYMNIRQKVVKADLILVLCSLDIRVAEYAAELYFKGYAPLILFSGGQAHQNDLLATKWNEAEADHFAKIAVKLGVPLEKILIEDKATNTGGNIVLSHNLLKRKSIKLTKMILVQKPFMLRRTYATFMKQWPGVKPKIILTSPPISFNGYADGTLTKEKFINIMVGDLQRIKIYSEEGHQIKQNIPKKVWQALEGLVKLGYDKHIIQ